MKLVLAALAAFALSGDEIPEIELRDTPPAIRQALVDARGAVEKAPEDASAWGRLGALFDAHQLYEQAQTCYRQASELAPDDFRYVYLLALVSDLIGAPTSETMPLFERASKLEPGYPPAHLNRGHVAARHGDTSAARAAYARALEIDPAYPAAHRAMGQLLLNEGNAGAALKSLEAAYHVSPDDRATCAALAICYTRLGRRDEAREIARRSRTLDTSIGERDSVRNEVLENALSSNVCYARAQRCVQEGRYVQAVRDFRIVLGVRPDNAGLTGELGRALLLAAEYPEAKTTLTRAIELDDSLDSARLDLARTLIRLRDPQAAEALVRSVLTRDPERRGARGLLGVSAALQGRFDDADREFSAAGDGELEVNDYMMWGESLNRLQRPEQAIQRYRQAVALAPGFAPARFNLAVVLEAAGHVDEAIEQFREAGRLDPRLPTGPRLERLTGTSESPR